MSNAENPTESEGGANLYYYHSDHLGSAQMVTDYRGQEYERLEYTPWGEVWIDKAKASNSYDTPYRFTGKERDTETGLYYYGARYYDAKYSRWLSCDPALGEYIPQAPENDEAKKHNKSLAGQGGVFNVVNLDLYHYAANNPVKYTDPDGKQSFPTMSGKDLWALISQFDPFAKLFNTADAASKGDNAAQATLAAVTTEAGKGMAVSTLDATAKVAGATSEVTGNIAIGAFAVGDGATGGTASLISDAAGAVEVGSLSAKAAITKDNSDIKAAANKGIGFLGASFVGRILPKTFGITDKNTSGFISSVSSKIAGDGYAAATKEKEQ